MTLEEAIAMALQNNNDIDTSKIEVQIAEFNLRGARGVYDPSIVSETYYESATTPVASTIGGSTNGSMTQSRFFGSAGVSGFSPYQGGSYAVDFSSSRTNDEQHQRHAQSPISVGFDFSPIVSRFFAVGVLTTIAAR